MPKVTEEHRLARRAQIVAAARRCVIEEGFHKTTMADVIRESGLSAGAVYGYFKSKEEIVAAIAEDALSTVDELFERILADDRPLTPLAALEATIDHVVKVAEAARRRRHPGRGPGLERGAAQRRRSWRPRAASTASCATTSWRSPAARRPTARSTRTPIPRYIAQVMFGMVPGFVLQRLLIGDVTPETYSAGLRALLRS